MKNLQGFLAAFFNIKIADISNFHGIIYLRKGLWYLKNGGIFESSQRFFWLYGGKLLIEFNNTTRFGGHMHCDSGDNMITYSKGCVILKVEVSHSKSP